MFPQFPILVINPDKMSLCRSSRPEVFCKKDVFKNFAKFAWKQLRQSLFFNKVACLRPVTLLKKRLWHRCFPMNFSEISKSTFSHWTPPVAAFAYINPNKSQGTQILPHLARIFLAWSFNTFRRVIGIKIHFSVACLKKLFCKKSYQIETSQLVSIAYQTHIQNPAEYLHNEASFAKLVNGSESVTQRCSTSVKKVLLKFLQIHRKTPKPGSLF